jgi:hypothetical protein
MKLIAALEVRALGHPNRRLYAVSFDPLPEADATTYHQMVSVAEALRSCLLIGRSVDGSGIITLTFNCSLREVKAALRRHGELPELVAIMPDVAVPLQR